ncbi:MAG: SAM-dependent methyltransferase, partial [Paracoccaceae bacterium]|nr:SAM-dependent methyltransferase [Paracoccaceae bacterium]
MSDPNLSDLGQSDTCHSDLGQTECWLSVIGIGEDGLAGLTDASRDALAQAEIVFGGRRHLALAGIEVGKLPGIAAGKQVGGGARGQAWEVPFSLAPVLALRGRRVAVLASGDPFWHGAGGALLAGQTPQAGLAPQAGQTPQAGLAPGEWRSFPAVSCFQIAANRLGWKLEDIVCLGLHAAPFTRLVPVLSRDMPVICTLRDGAAVGALAAWLCDNGFAATTLWVMEALGGPRERMRRIRAPDFALAGVSAPVIVGLQTKAAGLARGFGLPDAMFAQDGQITKRPIRAMTLAALAPRPGARLWDLGAGSGSVSVE